jgi:hypothetical protein
MLLAGAVEYSDVLEWRDTPESYTVYVKSILIAIFPADKLRFVP